MQTCLVYMYWLCMQIYVCTWLYEQKAYCKIELQSTKDKVQKAVSFDELKEKDVPQNFNQMGKKSYKDNVYMIYALLKEK